jgi:formate-dependent nitrite reductase membrane component NrfD
MAQSPRESFEPTVSIGDGRNLDPTRADEHGEGAQIEIESPEIAWPISPEAHPTPNRAPSETYYDLPVVKAPPWKWYVPAYFYFGGLAGAASSLAGAVQLAGRASHAPLERKLHWISTAGEAIGGVCLIADLGRPARFHHMIRVFRPTSPMNVGTWILSAASATSGWSLLGSLCGRERIPRPTVSGVTGAIAGTMLSTYTGVLLGNTAIPVWKATRRQLPLWYASLSAASLASLLELGSSSTAIERRLVRAYSIGAKTAAFVTLRSVVRAADAEGVGQPLREGSSGRMWRYARWLAAGSLIATVLPGGRKRAWIAGALGTASAVLSRFAIVAAGHASAADPRATFEPQRRALELDP